MNTLLVLPRRGFFTVLLAAFAGAALVVMAAPAPASACGDGGEGSCEGHQCPFALEGVEVAGENLSNGARLTVTSDNEDNVEVIQAWAARHAEGQGCRHHRMEGVEISVVTLSNGARLTFTSDDNEAVTRIQEMVRRKAAGEGCGHEGSGHGEGHECGCRHRSSRH